MPLDPSEQPANLLPLASLWHRAAAIIFDSLLLGIVGHGLGWFFWSTWYQIGPYGRLVGLPIMLLYFGLLNSHLGGGQTLGKRFVKIAVCNAAGQPIGLARSLLRITILATPLMLVGWALPIFEIDLLHWLQLSLVLGLSIALLYTLLFNKASRQGWHDLLCGSYVVHLEGQRVASYPPTSARHSRLAMLLIGLATGLAGFLTFVQPADPAPTASALEPLRHTLVAQNRFFTVRVTDRLLPGQQPEAGRLLDVVVWHKGYLTTPEAQDMLLNDLAATALAETPGIDEFELLNISVSLAYDLGIAQRSLTISAYQSIPEWRQSLAAP